MKNKKTFQCKAFTLMELMVVILIIGTMASISIPRFTKTIEQSYEKESVLNLLTIKKALDFYKMDHNGYPIGNLDDITAINNTLGLGIVDSKMTYQCINGTASHYDCRSTSPSGWQVRNEWSFLPDIPHCNTATPPCPTCTMDAKCPFLP